MLFASLQNGISRMTQPEVFGEANQADDSIGHFLQLARRESLSVFVVTLAMDNKADEILICLLH